MDDRRKAAGSQPGVEVFVENLPGNVYRRVRRPDGKYKFEYLSSGLFRQFGIDHERLLTVDTIQFDWVHPEDRTRMISDLEVSAATLGLLDHRIRVVGQDGRTHWARGIGRPSRRQDGAVVWDGIVIDVTREVEAEAALRFAKAEADRAHQSAALLVGGAVERLSLPVGQLRHLLHAPGVSELAPDFYHRLETIQAQLAAALGSLCGAGVMDVRTATVLTGRQHEVLRLLAAGLSNKSIAKTLKITPGTVKLHVAAVLKALGVTSRRALIQLPARSDLSSAHASPC